MYKLKGSTLSLVSIKPGFHHTVNATTQKQVQRYLITTKLSELLKFLHKLLQEMKFKHVHLFLVLFGNFYWEIYFKH